MNKTASLLVVLILLLLSACAAGASADGKDLYIDRNVQKIFTSEDGLLSTSTQAVAQTAEGFIWIGGYGGLVRYDGRDFMPLAYKQITRVTDLAAGNDGAMWVATSDKGVYRYQNHEFTAVASGEGVSSDVECLAFTPDGRLLLGTSRGLCAVDCDVAQTLDVPGLNGETIDALLCPEDDLVLCVTRAGALFACDHGEIRRAGGEDVFRSVCWNAADGTCLAGTSEDEVLVFDRGLNAVDRLKMDGLSCINDLRLDESGALWLCADNGVAIYLDGSTRMQNLLMQNSVDQMMVDNEGNFWFVSSRQGVLEVSRSMFGDVSRSAGLDSMVVNAIQRIGDTMYIGHDAGLVAIDTTDFKALPSAPPAELKGVRVRTLLADSGNNLWIGTMGKGLFCRTPDGQTLCYDCASCPAMASNNIRTVAQTDDGILFTTDVGAYLIQGGEVKNVVDDPPLLAFRILNAAKFGDTYYLGSDGTGLYLVRDGQVVRHLTTEDGLSSNVVMKIYRSRAFDGVWLVTGNDLAFLGDDGSVTSISSFPSTNNLDLLMPESGDVWLLTGTGIFQTTEDSLLHDSQPRHLLFRRVDGLPYEITPNSFQCLTGDMLYICGSGGVFSLQTDFAQTESGEYQMIIDSITADGRTISIQPGQPCEIDANVKRIDINAYVLTYQTGNPFVFYDLDGFDDGETVAQLSDIGGISYTNLNGGNYTFRYGIRDYKTGDVLQEIQLPIVKKRLWFEQPQVRVIGALLGLLALVLVTLLVIHSRSRRIKRSLQAEYEQKEKTHLKNIAYRDYLTGLFNRNYLDVWHGQLLPDSDYPVTFVSLDMNDLKKINDKYGHKDGDQLLCSLAELLKKYFGGDRYSVLRTGGDEFLILARGVDAGEVTDILERLTAEAATIQVSGIPVSFAYGICTQQKGEFDFDAGLRLSDLELLENKNRFHGRG